MKRRRRETPLGSVAAFGILDEPRLVGPRAPRGHREVELRARSFVRGSRSPKPFKELVAAQVPRSRRERTRAAARRIDFVLLSNYILNRYSESARIFDTRFSQMFRETF